MSVKVGPPMVDQNELRTTQALGLTLLTAAALLARWELVAVHAAILLIALLQPRLSPYVFVYRFVLVPLGLIRRDLRHDHLAAHRFATLLGVVFTATASFLLITGHSQIGWFLVWLVVALTAVALLGWCAGCFTYYTLHLLGLTRFFKHAPIACTIPGARPPKSKNQDSN